LDFDAAGNMYVVGFSTSPDAPITPGAWQARHGGATDALVARFDPEGRLVASTFFGGAAGDGVDGVSVSADGYLVWVGETHSDDLFTTPDAHQDAIAADVDGYTVLMDPDLRPVYASYLGGQGHDNIRGAYIDDACSFYVVGASAGPGYPTVNAWQPDFAGGAEQWGNGDNVITRIVVAP
ncbi:MAG: hypothetical protein H6703_16910, partial [Myxococcales bacterium]|nr:hypothetical protein [Myxococcales bacterium]